MNRVLVALLACTAASCKVPSLIYQCARDTQCTGSGGRCVDAACAFPSAMCASGLVYDASAGTRSGQCVDANVVGDDDMSIASDQDLAMLADMATSLPPADLATHCTWHAMNNLPEASVRIFATDASHLVAAGDNLSVSNTSGVGWSGKLLRDANNLGVHVHALYGFGSTVFAACSGQNVFMMDAAQTVTLDHPGGASADLFGMWGASASDLWAIGDGGLPLRRQGTTWTVGAGSVTNGSDMQAMHGTSATNIWAAGDFVVTHWDGATWTPQTLNTGGAGITSIYVRDAQNIYVTQAGGSFYASHDGGATWGGGATGMTSGFSIFGFPGHLWVSGMGNSIAHSIDDGAHWTLEDTGMMNGQINQVWGRSPTELYAVGGTWWAICN